MTRTTCLRCVQRKTAAVLCLCECVKRLVFFNTSVSKRGTRRHYITRRALTKPSTESHPHFLENRIHHLSARQPRILPPWSIRRFVPKEVQYVAAIWESSARMLALCTVKTAYVKVRLEHGCSLCNSGAGSSETERFHLWHSREGGCVLHKEDLVSHWSRLI